MVVDVASDAHASWARLSEEDLRGRDEAPVPLAAQAGASGGWKGLAGCARQAQVRAVRRSGTGNGRPPGGRCGYHAVVPLLFEVIEEGTDEPGVKVG